MESKLHYNTSSQQLLGILKTLMAAKEFNSFRLVGGTALGLLRGHRESVISYYKKLSKQVQAD